MSNFGERRMFCRLAALIDAWNLKASENEDGCDRRLNQRKIALETGLATSTLNRLYNNDFTRVDVQTVETLCNYLGCEIGELFVLKE